MVYVYSGSNTTAPIGKVMDYNNTNPSRSVEIYRMLTSNPVNFVSNSGQADFSSDFASAIYRNGQYSLLHPNSTTDTVAQYIDTLA